MTNLSRIYGNRPKQPIVKPDIPAPVIPKDKKPQNVLGGMKIHGSHMKRLQFEDGFMDVPKIEYVRLLEEQIKDLRSKQREQISTNHRLTRAITKLQNQIQDLTVEVRNKVDLRKKAG